MDVSTKTSSVAAADLTGFTREGVEALSRAKNEPAWVLEARLAAWEIYDALPMPTRQDEEWRRTDLRRLKLDQYAPFAGTDQRVSALGDVLHAEAEEHALQFGEADQRAGIIVNQDSGTAYTELDPTVAAQGAIFVDLDTAIAEYPELVKQYFMTEAVPVSFGKFQALHAAFWQTGSLLYVPKGVSITLPFRQFVQASAPGASTFSHSLVVIEEGAEAFFVDAFQSATQAEPAFTSHVVELIVRADAKLRYVQVQDWGRHVFNFMTERSVLGRDTELKSLQVTLGSKFTKNSIGSHLRGENSLAEMLGIFFGDEDQFFDHHTWQLHESPYATSDLEFKGAMKER